MRRRLEVQPVEAARLSCAPFHEQVRERHHRFVLAAHPAL
jgi:hypothetical protein